MRRAINMWSFEGDSQENHDRKGREEWMDINDMNDIPASLSLWNLSAAIFQFGQAGILFYLSSRATTDWFLFTNFPITATNGTDAFGAGPESVEVVGFPVVWYSAIFLFLSGLDHLATITPGLRGVYEYYIERHQNPFRWIEYSLSASLMRVMIAQLSGVTDVHLLFCIFMLTATTMLLGWAHESVNAKARADGFRQNWFPFFAAWIPHLASWMVIFCYFFVSVSRADPPNFVWAIVIILFILDATFAVLFYMQWGLIWIFDDYINGEIGFIVLSFTSKTLLAWLNYGGGAR